MIEIKHERTLQENSDKCQTCRQCDCLKELTARMASDRVTRIPDNISEENFLTLLALIRGEVNKL